jgi:hypothetical protein
MGLDLMKKMHDSEKELSCERGCPTRVRNECELGLRMQTSNTERGCRSVL